jgi:hypothetical protein
MSNARLRLLESVEEASSAESTLSETMHEVAMETFVASVMLIRRP